MTSHSVRAYVLVELCPVKEKEDCEEIIEKGLILDSKVECTDLVHGSYDFICVLNGQTADIDRRIIELRRSYTYAKLKPSLL